MRLPLFVLAILAAGTSCARRGSRRIYLELHAPAIERIDLDRFGWHSVPGARAFARLTSTRAVLTVDVPDDRPPIAIVLQDACTTTIATQGIAQGARIAVPLRSRLRVPANVAQVGYDTDFEVRAEAPCPEDEHPTIEWVQISGESLAPLRVEDGGRAVRGRSLPFARHHPQPVAAGLVPLSPRTQGWYSFVARFASARGPFSRRVEITAAARSTGVPSIAPHQRVFLGGGGWHVTERPPGGHSDVIVQSGMEAFDPDVAGRWVLSRAGGGELQLGANRYDDTALDCGRAECHASATRDAAHSPMTRVLHAGLTGQLGPSYRASCAIRCHAVGEPGTEDGGFTHLARDVDYAPGAAFDDAWDMLPRPLRRLGGVGCAACHGPGALPQRDARWAILRTDVCATCHDLPQRYAHVAAWQSNSMSRADTSPATRSTPRCSQCHTTHGFLAAIGARTVPSAPPDDAGPVGITCAACHAPHAAASGPRLLRRLDDATTFDGARAALGATWDTASVCVRCHAPRPDAAWPEASAAAIVLARGARFADRAPSLPPASAHAAVAQGCVGCHRGSAPAVSEGRGTGHAFRADRSVCVSCHAPGSNVERPDAGGRTIAQRLDGVLAALVARGAIPAAFAHPLHVAMNPPQSALQRAAWDALLIRGDRAVAMHNARFARALLDQIERVLGLSTLPP